jgi:hypothetical protein
MTKLIAGETTGVYRVTTRSGSQYTLDFDNGVAVRYNRDVPIRSWDGSQVPSNGEAMPWSYFKTVEVGECLYIEMLDQWVQSTPVVSIEKWEDNGTSA